MTKKNLFSVFFGEMGFTIRYYQNTPWFGYRSWGTRDLGGKKWYPRVSLDCGKISFIFERYY